MCDKRAQQSSMGGFRASIQEAIIMNRHTVRFVCAIHGVDYSSYINHIIIKVKKTYLAASDLIKRTVVL